MEAGHLDCEGLIDVPGKGLTQFFKGFDLPNDLRAEVPSGTLPCRTHQMGDHILPKPDQLARGGGGLDGFLFLVPILFAFRFGLEILPCG